MARRSLLFTPGDRPSMMRKAPEAGADVLVFDLEDAVSPDAKDAARAAVRDVLSDPSFDPAVEVFVRLNPVGLSADEDLDVLAEADGRPDGVMLPKIGDADDVTTGARMLEEHDFPQRIIPLAESAGGVLHAEGIAAADATVAIAFGAEDLAADIGATRTEEGVEVLHAREHVVLAAGAAGVDAIDTVFTDFEDTAGLEEDARFAVRLGYDGKLAIHPDQVDPINRAFTPDGADVEWARRVVAAREESGQGVFSVDGEMIDAPLLAQAERILERADAADSS
ncbi:Beta-methylmalyl-CoA lyase, Citrate lyase beta subunit family [Halanaeroarchaeum sp. HSR-CO]|uniref:HpcH/HpaI aldolase/citrate lyase family protein n=1 Tax=Halanaeroarchaeum sp. HSR-CO TaxID=2866382 RepID=UPI00217D2AA4|nr:CoA ester lyase [Halanaeroarchaeum sp. HSR-CO]UWG47590.1 Beta-methylmalyl-CoA lyase, Citrate lyase beta subunit family [Halanaeroarchaeum sp. HSR-CO]